MKNKTLLIYLLSIITSGAGFCTQILTSGYWSAAYSNDVFHFSWNLAFYFLSLGVGSLATKWVKKSELKILVYVSVFVVLWLGLSISLLRYSIFNFGENSWVPCLLVFVSGFFTGGAMPLSLRVAEGNKQIQLPVLFFLDYIAAIIFSFVLTFVLLIPFGYCLSALLLSLFLIVVVFLMLKLNHFSSPLLVGVGLVVSGILILFYSKTQYLWRFQSFDKGAGKAAKILYKKQSHYQKIILTEEIDESAYLSNHKTHVLYLDGFVQFSSSQENIYHACISNVPMAVAEYVGQPVRSALVLGGGDGLVVRNLLGNQQIQKIKIVELDPAMIELAQKNEILLSYNLNSLNHPKVTVVASDAFQWVRDNEERFDLIIIDFPYPKNLSLARLFSAEFYQQVFKLLKPNGVLAVQAGPARSYYQVRLEMLSPVTACVQKTVEAIGYPSFIYLTGDNQDSFLLSVKNKNFNMDEFSDKTGMNDPKSMGMICYYQKEWQKESVVPNTLNTLGLSNYMVDWMKKVGKVNYNYQGEHAVFLPD